MLQFSCGIIDKHQQTAFRWLVLQTSHDVSHQFGSAHHNNPGYNEPDTGVSGAWREESTDLLQSPGT